MPSPRVKLSEPLPLRRVAEMLGWTGKYAAERLKRRLQRIELEKGERIMTRQGRAGTGQRYFVTMRMLRTHLPEMFDPVEDRRQEVVDAFRGVEADIERAEEKCISRHGELQHKFRSLTARVAALERLLRSGMNLPGSGKKIV